MWSAAVTVFIYALAICVSAAPARVFPPPAGSPHLLVSSPDAPVQGADSPQPRSDAVLSEIGNPLVDLLPIPDREKLALSSRTTASGPPSRREEEDIDLNAHVDLNVRGLGHLQDAGNPLVPILGFTAPSSTAHVAASLPTTTSATRPRHKSARARDDSALNYPGNPLPAVLCRLFGACRQDH